MSTIATEILNGHGLKIKLALECFPPRRSSKPISYSTIHRWITSGVRLPDGSTLRLEGLRVGGCWLTSREAVQRFIEAQAPQFREATPCRG